MTALSAEFLDAALGVALRAADAAEAVISRHYRAQFSVEIKSDASPVTVADREAELAISAVIRSAYPDHAFFGEEYGRSGESEYLWLVDPIDGTKAFVRGYPMFSTQIALMYRGELVLGVSSAMQFGERAFARLGGGAHLNGRRVFVSATGRLADAQLSLGNVKSLAADPRRWLALARSICEANRTRGYGDFLHYHYLACGAVDAVVESDVNILDIAALAVIVREAGAVVTDLDGAPLTLRTRSVLAAVPALHEELRLRLA